MDLVLIRHGQSQWNLNQTGGADAPLTALGRAQAQRAGLYCQSQLHLNALYASTYQRARDTALIINSFLNLPRVELLEDLREFDYEYDGAMNRFTSPIAAFEIETMIAPTQVGKEYEAFQVRVMRGIQHILRAHEDWYNTDAQIGIVSHGGTMGTILRSFAGSHHFSLSTSNTGIGILRWEHSRWHILALNRIEHLECDQWSQQADKDA